MPRTITQTKSKKAATPVDTNTQQEEQLIEAFPKAKKAIILEEPELIPGVTEEKLDEDGMPIEEGEDTDSDEAGIDDEELNPFGDKWEE